MQELYFVTSNPNKLKEAENILQRKLNMVTLEVPEIQAMHVKSVVEEKARRAYEKFGKPLIVEDTGFHIKALNDFPGALIKWLIIAVGYQGLCELLNGHEDRSAYTETSVCFYDGKEVHTFTGKVEGNVPEKPRGDNGFAWDTVFQPKGFELTFAEMKPEEKNKISHRAIAFMKLKAYLESAGL